MLFGGTIISMHMYGNLHAKNHISGMNILFKFYWDLTFTQPFFRRIIFKYYVALEKQFLSTKYLITNVQSAVKSISAKSIIENIFPRLGENILKVDQKIRKPLKYSFNHFFNNFFLSHQIMYRELFSC